MAKKPFGKKDDGLIDDVSLAEDTPGKGIFGNGVTDPLYSLEASRFKGGRPFSPNIIAVWPDRIEEHEVHAIRKSGVQAIHFRQVAQVAIETGLFYTNITVESAGGHVIRMMGVPGDDGPTIKQLIDEKVRAAHATPPSSVVHAAPPVDLVELLTRLAALRDSGVLTDEEFQVQKQKILDA